jgi:DNA-binding NarL/FixJ family response regulator
VLTVAAIPTTVRVVIADDHALVRQGLRRYLDEAQGLEVVGEGASGAEAVSLVERERPDVVVLDIRMPEVDGLQAAAVIHERWPETGIVILSAYGDRKYLIDAIRSGARGYVLKVRDAETLAQTVRLVASGSLVIDPQLAIAIAEELAELREPGQPPVGLTDRELEVLQLLGFGHTNRDIARKLYISPDTVKSHLEHIYQKLGASDRTAAVAEALRRRIID